METGARSDIGVVRKANEDSYYVGRVGHTGYLLMAVADGMGGYAAGEVASRVAIDALRQAIDRCPVTPGENDSGDYTEAIRGILVEAFQKANELVFQMGAHLPEYRGMGTTLTALVVPDSGGRRAAYCHVGDTRAYQIQDGVARQLTDDHSFVGQMVRDGALTEAEAMAHPHRNLLTRAIGTEDRVSVDSGFVDTGVHDRFMICSDGLSSLVTPDEIAAIMAGSGSLQEGVDRLVELARSRGGHDDITAVAAGLGAGGEKP